MSLGVWRSTALTYAVFILAKAYAAQAGVNVWTSHGPGAVPIHAFAIDPLTPSTLYVGTDGGVFKSTNAGGIWSAAGTGLTSPIRALAIDPLRSTTLYAGTDGSVFRSTDGGSIWSAASGGLPNALVNALAIDPLTPSTLYAATCPGRACVGGGVFKSTDAGGAWSFASTDVPGFYGVFALAVDPITTSTLYAAGAGGVFKSTDAGGTWTAVNAGLTNSDIFNVPFIVALAIDPTIPTTLYAGTFDEGVFKSTNAGGTWSAANTGLPVGIDSTPFGALMIDPVTPTTLYAGAPGDFTLAGMGGVFKSTDGGSSWKALSTGLDEYALVVSALAIGPTVPTTLYAGTAAGVFDIEEVAVVPCVGDCNNDQAVTIDELLMMVKIALGNAQPSACATGVPSGATVDVALILQAVNNALSTCGGG